jgi:hypothetical protein
VDAIERLQLSERPENAQRKKKRAHPFRMSAPL